MNHKAIDIGATRQRRSTYRLTGLTLRTRLMPASFRAVRIVKMVKVMRSRSAAWTATLCRFPLQASMLIGSFERSAAAYEKRGGATVPHWNEATCVQCNQCANVCPHATIRPFALTDEEAAAARESAKLVDIKAGKARVCTKYTMAVSPLDCMAEAAASCIGVCPTKSP